MILYKFSIKSYHRGVEMIGLICIFMGKRLCFVISDNIFLKILVLLLHLKDSSLRGEIDLVKKRLLLLSLI